MKSKNKIYFSYKKYYYKKCKKNNLRYLYLLNNLNENKISFGIKEKIPNENNGNNNNQRNQDNQNQLEFFSFINDDYKNFLYVKRYIDILFTNSKNQITDPTHTNFLILKEDNKIQYEEILEHLKNIGLDVNKENNIELIQKESIDWIKRNSKAFRIYLNSLKLITLLYFSHFCKCKDCKNLKNCNNNQNNNLNNEKYCENAILNFDYEVFKKIKEVLNINKFILVDTIFLN